MRPSKFQPGKGTCQEKVQICTDFVSEPRCTIRTRKEENTVEHNLLFTEKPKDIGQDEDALLLNGTWI
jgi:hypothetical protein